MGRSPKRSKDRTRGTAKKLALALIPGGDLIDVLLEHGGDVRREDLELRERRFHEELLRGCPTRERAEALVAELMQRETARTYASFYEAALRDDEAEKIEHYAALLRFLAQSGRDPRDRRYLLRLMRELSKTDIETLLDLHEAVTAARKKLPTSGDGDKAETTVMHKFKNPRGERDPWRRLSMQRFETYGVVHWNGDALLSRLAHQLVEALRA